MLDKLFTHKHSTHSLLTVNPKMRHRCTKDMKEIKSLLTHSFLTVTCKLNKILQNNVKIYKKIYTIQNYSISRYFSIVASRRNCVDFEQLIFTDYYKNVA